VASRQRDGLRSRATSAGHLERKDKDAPVPVRLLQDDGPRYQLGDFIALLPVNDDVNGHSSMRVPFSAGVSVVDRARRYVMKMPEAIEHQLTHEAEVQALNARPPQA
jgi:hypothetical protein